MAFTGQRRMADWNGVSGQNWLTHQARFDAMSMAQPKMQTWIRRLFSAEMQHPSGAYARQMQLLSLESMPRCRASRAACRRWRKRGPVLGGVGEGGAVGG